MPNTIEKYSDSDVLRALLTRDFSGVGYEFVEDSISSVKAFAFAGITDLQTFSMMGVTQIPDGAFYKTEVSSSFVLNWQEITRIGRFAFAESDCLRSGNLVLLKAARIDRAAFYHVTGLTSVLAPALTSSNRTESGYEDGGVFEGSSIQSFSAAELVNGSDFVNMFKDCTSLASVSLPKITSLAYHMFDGCTALESISLPLLVSNSESYVFQNCTALAQVSLPLLSSVTGGNMFSGCTDLEEISLPELTATGSHFLSGCTKLRSVSLPKLTQTGVYTFIECSALTAFSGSLVITVGAYTFSKCTNLSTVYLPECTSCGNSSFEQCKALVNIDLPKVSTLGMSMFSGCNKLKVIKLGGNIRSIPSSCFWGTNVLESLVLSGISAVPTGNSSMLLYSNKMNAGTGYVYVPDALVSDFQNAQYWSNFQIRPISEFVEPS